VTSADCIPFLITIDTEGDDLWSKPRRVSTKNVSFLPRFQELCELHGLRPTWLANYEMILDPAFVAFASDILRRGVGEIGTHLHAWDSPPSYPLTSDDAFFQPYLIEYPVSTMREKIRTQTALLEDALGVKMTSHRAGRWAFDERYAQILIDEGYTVDCSVTPLVTWEACLGDPAGNGGSDYRRFPRCAYFVDTSDVALAGGSSLLEVPVTIVRSRGRGFTAGVKRLLRRTGGVEWLRPNGRNIRAMVDIVGRVKSGELPYAHLTLHSSELMPAGSPVFLTHESIEALYGDLAAVFDAAAELRGMTLSEFYEVSSAVRAA
jgi:hypothetical protein